MVINRHQINSLVCAFWLFSTISPAFGLQAEDELHLGVDRFNAGHFRRAVKHLSLAITQSPKLALAHYYLAVSLEHLKRSPEAIEQYRWCYALEPTGTLGNYCNQALQNYARVDLSTGAQTKSPTLAKTIATMTEQATLDKAIQTSLGGARAAERIRGGYRTAEILRREQTDQVNYMRSAMIYDDNGNAHPMYSEAQIESAKSSYDRQIASVGNQAQKEALEYNSLAKQRTSAIDQTLSNLASQMSNSVRSSGSVSLSPVGTNLYVRTYAQDNSSPKEASNQPELIATQNKLIVESHTAGGKSTYNVVPEQLAASEDQLAIDAKNQSFAKLKVHGNLIQH